MEIIVGRCRDGAVISQDVLPGFPPPHIKQEDLAVAEDSDWYPYSSEEERSAEEMELEFGGEV